MNDILGSHREFYWNAHRHMELVDVTPAIEILDLPHPLLPNHENFHGRCRRNSISNKERSAPPEHHNADACRNNGPRDFKREIVSGWWWRFVPGAATVFHREIEYYRENQKAEKDEDSHFEVKQVLPVICPTGSLGELAGKLRRHGFPALF